MTALPCQNVVAKIVATDTPVLFLDTCSLLDIVRVPVRQQASIQDIEAIHLLLARAEATPSTLSIIVDEQVHREITDHLNDVTEETKRDLKKKTENLQGVLERMAALAPNDSIPTAIDLLALDFPQRGKDIANRFLTRCLLVEDSDQETLKAVARVQKATPPATRAKQSVKDCVIVETYIRVAAEMNGGGFERNKVFLSSNTKDYHQEHSSLHPSLRSEFNTVSLEFSPCWAAARYELDR